jgi:predicted acyl esterase
MEKDTLKPFGSILDDVSSAMVEAREKGLSDYEGIFNATVAIATQLDWHRVFITNLMDLLETKEVVTREERAELRAKTDKTLNGIAEKLIANGVEGSEK